MFENTSESLKKVGNLTFLLGCIVAALLAVLSLLAGTGVAIIEGIVLIAVVLLSTYVSALCTYALAEIAESEKETCAAIKKINATLELVLRNDVERATAEVEQEEIRKRRIEEAMQRKAEEEVRKQQEMKEAAERLKKERYTAYWEDHKEDWDALIQKKEEAESKLKELSPLAREERKTIQDLIRAIEDELSRDR